MLNPSKVLKRILIGKNELVCFLLISIILQCPKGYADESLFICPFDSAEQVIGLNGTIGGGVTFIPGKVSNGFLADSDGEFIFFPSAGRINAAEGTIEMWVRPTVDLSSLTSHAVLFELFHESNNYMRVYYNANNKNLVVRIVRPSDSCAIQVSASWLTDELHHIAWTWGSDGVLLYVDGKQVAADDTFSVGIDSIAANVVFGSTTWNTWPSKMVIDEVAIYDSQRWSQDKLVHSAKMYLPHGWGAYFIHKNVAGTDYIFMTQGESERKLAVIDATDVNNPEVIAFRDSGAYRLNKPSLDGDMLISMDHYGVAPFDITDPTDPVPVLDQTSGKRIYLRPDGASHSDNCAMRDGYVYLASFERMDIRVFPVTSPFTVGDCVATIDLEQLLRDEYPDTAEIYDLVQAGGYNPLQVEEMVFRDNILHVALGILVVGLDISDPANPSVDYLFDDQQGEQINGIALHGDHLFVCSSSLTREYKWFNSESLGVLEVVDISDPLTPVIAEYTGVKFPHRVTVSGDTMYLAVTESVPYGERLYGEDKIKIADYDMQCRLVLHSVDISDLSNMIEVDTFDFSTRAAPLTARVDTLLLKNDHLFVGDYGYGLRIMDVSDRADLQQISKVALTGEADDVYVSNDRVYTTSEHPFTNCLHIADVSDPYTPILTDRNRETEFPGRIPRAGTDILEDGESMSRRYLYQLGQGQYLFTSEFYDGNYVTDRISTIMVIDTNAPDAPVLSSIIVLPLNLIADKAIEWGEHVYVLATRYEADRWSVPEAVELLIYQKMSDDADLDLIKRLDIQADNPMMTFCIDPIQDYAYIVTCQPSADIEWGGAYWKWKTTAPDENHPEMLESQSLTMKLITVDKISSDPVNAEKIFQAEITGAVGRKWSEGRGMEYRDDKIFLLGGTKNYIDGSNSKMLYVYDVRDPSTPVLLSSLPNHDLGFRGVTDMLSLYPYPKLLFQDYRYGLRLVDISNPLAPMLIWQEPLLRECDEVSPEYVDISYGRIGFTAGNFKKCAINGSLLIARLGHLDVFNLNFEMPDVDLDGDGDVDGADLADFMNAFTYSELETFAMMFGRANCLP